MIHSKDIRLIKNSRDSLRNFQCQSDAEKPRRLGTNVKEETVKSYFLGSVLDLP